MRKMFDIAMLKLRITLKDRGALIWMFLAPLLFVVILVFGFGGGSDSGEAACPIGVVNRDNGKYSTQLIDMLKGDSAFEIVEGEYEEIKRDVERGNTAMAVIIPENYSAALERGSGSQIEILKLQENENTISISAVVENYVNQQRFSISTGDSAVTMLSSIGKIKEEEKEKIKEGIESSFMENIKSPRVGYEVKKVVNEENDGLDDISYSAIGILVMFIMYFVSGGAGSIFEEKETGTWNRMSSTPTKYYSIFGGHILGTFILGWIQSAVLILVSRYVFHVNWGSSPLGLIMLFSSYLLAIIGLGSALSSFVKTRAQLSALTAIIVMPTSLIGGCMWPREVMPDLMLKISNFVPQTWILKGMTDLVSRGSDIGSVYVPTIILLIFAAVFFLTGINFMRLQNRQ